MFFSFYTDTPTQRKKRNINEYDYIISNYIAKYAMNVVIQGNITAESITSFIQYEAMTELKNASIGTRDTDNTYIEEEVIKVELANQSKFEFSYFYLYILNDNG